MNCKKCDYPLWNLEARQCPECGTTFAPSQYRFSLNSVRFCCPGCRTAYYGQSASGHLVPPEFDCVTCSRHLKMDEMVLLPAAGIAEQLTRGESMPWIERARLGRLAAWFSTFSKALSSPERLIAITPTERPFTEALWYALSVMGLFFSINMGIFFVPNLLVPSSLVPRHGFMGVVLGAAIGIFGLAAIIIAAVLLYTASVHLMLMITGGTDRPFRRTLQCTCYSAPAAVFSVLPCVGVFGAPITLIWWYIASAQMLIASHRIGGLRAAAAVSALPGSLLALLGIMFVVSSTTAGVGKFTISTGAGTVTTQSKSDEISPIYEALNAYAKTHDAYPVHPMQLVAADPLLVPQLTTDSSMDEASIAGVALSRVLQLAPDQIAAMTADAVSKVNAATPITRAGDFLFMTQPMPTTPPLPGSVWIAMLMPQDPKSRCTVISVDGSTERFRRSELAGAIVDQNLTRSKAGLQPIPSPEAWP
ncbi:MAG: Yip1 family protein [Planctomycetota bacterium]|nr:Yip1 family protein [Planctomycetota bacterium]